MQQYVNAVFASSSSSAGADGQPAAAAAGGELWGRLDPRAAASAPAVAQKHASTSVNQLSGAASQLPGFQQRASILDESCCSVTSNHHLPAQVAAAVVPAAAPRMVFHSVFGSFLQSGISGATRSMASPPSPPSPLLSLPFPLSFDSPPAAPASADVVMMQQPASRVPVAASSPSLSAEPLRLHVQQPPRLSSAALVSAAAVKATHFAMVPIFAPMIPPCWTVWRRQWRSR